MNGFILKIIQVQWREWQKGHWVNAVDSFRGRDDSSMGSSVHSCNGEKWWIGGGRWCQGQGHWLIQWLESVPLTETGHTKKRLGEDYETILNILNISCLWDIQLKMSSGPFGHMGSWCRNELCKYEAIRDPLLWGKDRNRTFCGLTIPLGMQS